LPAQPAPARRLKDREAVAARKALVVDDSISIRQMVCATLRQAGFAVAEGRDGKDGLEQADGQHFDLIITDLNMPVMDGLSFIREIRTRPQYRFTPVLMLTTEAHESRKQAGKAAGATGWLVKPFHPQQLLQVIGRVLP
jgi:two-component system chemotaxis response regulator CheY